jgi:hypothetical protein
MGRFVKLTDVNGDEVWVRKAAIIRIEPRKRGRGGTSWVTFADGGHIETAEEAEKFVQDLEAGVETVVRSGGE